MIPLNFFEGYCRRKGDLTFIKVVYRLLLHFLDDITGLAVVCVQLGPSERFRLDLYEFARD